MPDQIKHTWDVHHMTIMWVCLFTIGSLGSSALTALSGTDWSAADGQTRLMIYIAIFVNWSTVMGAFLNQAISRAKKGEDILPGSGTTPPTQP